MCVGGKTRIVVHSPSAQLFEAMNTTHGRVPNTPFFSRARPDLSQK